MIALIGSGNVAFWLAERLKNSKEFPIGQVYSRNMEHARDLADRVGAEAIDDLSKLSSTADLYVFSIKDDAYAEVLPAIPFRMPVAVHTAGSVSQSVFANYADNYGVIYPLQTFTKGISMADVEVPLCLEIDSLGNALEMVDGLAAELSGTRCRMTEQQRSVVHLAAVFACNFSNAMYTIADDLLKADGLNLEIMLPILRQTLGKLKYMSPREAQTGPAVRHDEGVMQCHLQALTDPDLKNIYETVSSYIANCNL